MKDIGRLLLCTQGEVQRCTRTLKGMPGASHHDARMLDPS
ncbi:hypothetical protein T261_07320 [Streptomyces lydicus]|nr:hypothetical protein T261_07320 [Streptomyces lydicus]